MTLAPFVALLMATGASQPAGAGGAPPACRAGLASRDEWFCRTEQALMDAIGRGDRAPWERVADPGFVMTTEEGELVTRERLFAELRPLPAGLSGRIEVRDLSAQRLPGLAVVRFLAEESETVFGQQLVTHYRVTDVYREQGTERRLVASHLSVVTRDPPAQAVSSAGWVALAGRYRLLPDGWSFDVSLRDGTLYGGRAGSTPRPFVPVAPDAFVLSGSLGEWLFVREGGRVARVVNLRKFAVLVWTRVEGP